MSEKIEFEVPIVEVYISRRGGYSARNGILLPSGFRVRADKYKVTVEPVEPGLKLCPFCGGMAREAQYRDSGHYYIKCGKCGLAGTDHATLVEAIEAWNRRAL
jgi:Lar family restriction alleviation protein